MSGRPQVRLLDALELDIGPETLRKRARSLGLGSGAPYVSRSYRYPYALVGWHTDRIGVDIERIGPLDPAFGELICTPDERSALATSGDTDTDLTSLWCAKEALAKGLGDALFYHPARLESPSRWPCRRSGPWHTAQLAVAPDHIAWLCWRSVDLPPSPAG